MYKVVACIIARTVSSRLPLKVLRDLIPNTTILDFIIKNIQQNAEVDEIYLCTSNEPVDDILEDVAKRNSVKIYRGSANDVTERLSSVAEIEKADILVRITGDNPFCAVEYIQEQAEFIKSKGLDYVRVNELPIGASCEVFTVEALKKCMSEMDRSVSEYLMLFLFQPSKYRCGVLTIREESFGGFSLTVDLLDDLIRTRGILERLEFDGDYSKVKLESILDIIKVETSLPALRYEPSGDVKLPYGKTVPYSEFKRDMERRVNASFQKQLYE